jgi:hypothetical protein
MNPGMLMNLLHRKPGKQAAKAAKINCNKRLIKKDGPLV